MKFNILKRNPKVVTNYEGAKAYQLTPEMELYAAVVTAGLSDTFYEKADTRLGRVQNLMKTADPEFVAKLAVYARKHMYMRSIPMVLAVEMARMPQAGTLVRKTVKGVVQRADEITELLAFYQLANKRSGAKKLNRLSKQLQKGLGDAFNRFDEYQFAKYNRDAEVKLRDALFLVHPKPKDEAQQLIFNKIASNKLNTPYTWETELSALGKKGFGSAEAKAAAFRAKWEELIDSGRLGYMALLRNLRNILQAEVSTRHIIKICSVLSNAEAVAGSKQFPFRFLSAYRELKEIKSGAVSMILNALEEAVVLSIRNVRGFDADTRVLIACDVSGSMQKAISPKSKILLYDIGLVLGMLMQSKCSHVVTGMFGDSWKIINMPSKSVLANADAFYQREGEVGYSTNGYKVITDLINRKERIDKVMIFTDCQMWDSTGLGNEIARAWARYKAMYPEAILYLFDLAGYGKPPVRTEADGVYLIAGWSDKIFDVLHALENGLSAIDKIKQMEL